MNRPSLHYQPVNAPATTHGLPPESATEGHPGVSAELFESALSGYWDWNLQTQAEYLSPAFKKMLGYKNHELPNAIGTWQKLIFLEDLPGFLASLNRHVKSRGREPFHNEIRYHHKNGSTVWVICAGWIIEWMPDGVPVRMVGCHVDISDHKRAEELRHERERLQNENLYLRERIRGTSDQGPIIGESQPVANMLALARKVAPTSSAVFITGETGTGKELLADMIHGLSPRKGKTMVKVNCAALPSALIESELFGREKGAYTGAMTRQIGRFEIADGSTIFLDEIGELPANLQAKLLRVLQNGDFERLGGNRTLKVDIRVVAATNRDPAALVEQGALREDLFHRLNVFPINVPPLRVRASDIPLLVWAFVREFNEKMGRKVDSIPKETMCRLQTYHWPGNIRELRNTVERAMIVATGLTLRVSLPDRPADNAGQPATLVEVERRHIIDVLRQTHWKISGKGGAANILGLVPTTLHSRMKKLGVSRPV